MVETTETTGRPSPLLVAGVLACLLHVALFASLHRRPLDDMRPELNPIDVTIEEPAPPAEAHAQQGRVEAEVTDPAMALGRPSTTTAPNEALTPPVDSATPTAPQDVLHTQDGDAPWSFRTTRGAVDLGLGDHTGSLGRQLLARGELEMPKPPAPPPPPPPPISPGVKMIQELDAMDVARGFGRGGPVVKAVEAVVRDAVPSEGSATFEVTVEKSGNVSVRVLEAALNRDEWERLTDAIAVVVKTKPIRFPTTGLGLRIAVRVTASDHAPTGKAMSFTGGPTAPPGAGDPTGRDDAMQPGGVSHSAPMFGGTPTGGGGGRQSRLVSAHEVYEQRL